MIAVFVSECPMTELVESAPLLPLKLAIQRRNTYIYSPILVRLICYCPIRPARPGQAETKQKPHDHEISSVAPHTLHYHRLHYPLP